jgi:hypothetical protein
MPQGQLGRLPLQPRLLCGNEQPRTQLQGPWQAWHVLHQGAVQPDMVEVLLAAQLDRVSSRDEEVAKMVAQEACVSFGSSVQVVDKLGTPANQAWPRARAPNPEQAQATFEGCTGGYCNASNCNPPLTDELCYGFEDLEGTR